MFFTLIFINDLSLKSEWQKVSSDHFGGGGVLVV